MASDIIKEGAPYADFAERLQKLRAEAGLSRDELGKKCGVVGRTIINYENGTRIPYADTAVKMAETFGITVEELLGTHSSAEEQARAKSLAALQEMYGKRGADQAQQIVDISGKLLAGGTLTVDQQQDFMLEMQKLFIHATERARAKYTPKKYRTEEKAEAAKEHLAAADAIDEELAQRQKERGGFHSVFEEDGSWSE